MPFLGSGYGALARVHLEAKTPLDEPYHCSHHAAPGAFAADVDVAIVCISHEAVSAFFELPVELVEHDVTEQRRERTTLKNQNRR